MKYIVKVPSYYDRNAQYRNKIEVEADSYSFHEGGIVKFTKVLDAFRDATVLVLAPGQWYRIEVGE